MLSVAFLYLLTDFSCWCDIFIRKVYRICGTAIHSQSRLDLYTGFCFFFSLFVTTPAFYIGIVQHRLKIIESLTNLNDVQRLILLVPLTKADMKSVSPSHGRLVETTCMV